PPFRPRAGGDEGRNSPAEGTGSPPALERTGMSLRLEEEANLCWPLSLCGGGIPPSSFLFSFPRSRNFTAAQGARKCQIFQYVEDSDSSPCLACVPSAVCCWPARAYPQDRYEAAMRGACALEA